MADLPGDLPRGVYARLGLWVPFMLVVGAMVSGLLISVFGTHKLQDSKHDMSI